MHVPKRILHYLALLSLFVIFSLPLQAHALEPAQYPYQIVFKIDSGDLAVDFNNPDETISDSSNRGAANDPGGYFNKKYFIGWSNVANYETTPDALLFYGYEPVSHAVDAGVTELYPIYISAMHVPSYFDDNAVYIDKNMSDQAITPDAEVDSKRDIDTTDHDIKLVFDSNKTKYDVLLNSSFDMNKVLVHWLYSGNGATILTNRQTSDKSSSAKNAQYTHVDLNVLIPDEVEVPEKLNLSFNGNYFQPYMMINTDTREKLTVEGAEDGWNITPLVSAANSKTTFTVDNPDKVRKLTLRVILRTNSGYGGKKIQGLSAQAVEHESMELKSEDNLFITKETALKQLKSNPKNNKTTITGYIDGFVVLPKVSFLDFSRSIPRLDAANPVSVGYYPLEVSFDKNTSKLGDTGEQNLGTAYVLKNSSLNGDELNTNTYPSGVIIGDTLLPDAPGFATDNLTYNFLSWNTSADGRGDKIDGDSIIKSNLTLYAQYSVDMLKLNEAPRLVLKDATITVGAQLDLTTLVVGATDTEDGKILNKVELLNDGNFNNQKVGVYEITFSVADSNGARVTKTSTVTVKEKEQESLPDNIDETSQKQNQMPTSKDQADGQDIPETSDPTSLSLVFALTGLTSLSITALASLKKH